MAGRRGRPSKAAQKELLERGASAIVDRLNCQPLRQPVDAAFSPFYERVLNGDLAAIFDFCQIHSETLNENPSFCELVGRLVQLRSMRSARYIVDEIVRGRGASERLKAIEYDYW